MAILTPAAEPGAVFQWSLRLSLVAFALQICAILPAVGLLLVSIIPLFQPWTAARQADASLLLLLQAPALAFYLPLTLTKEMRQRSPLLNKRGWLARLPTVSRVLFALGAGLWLFNFWFIPQWGQDLLRSATTPTAVTAFQSVANLHWVRVAAISALANGLVWLGFGYQWRWLAHQCLADIRPLS